MATLPFLRYRLNGAGWPVGPWLIPSGTTIDYALRADTWSKECWNRQLIPPLGSTPLDALTHDYMLNAYWFCRHLVGPPPT
jgi:hypothetical protein